MARQTSAIKLTYDDGTEAVVPVKPISLVAAERQFSGNIPLIEGSLWAAWHSLHKPMGNFDAWVSKIDNMEELDDVEPTGDASATTGGESPEVPPAG